jgi:hypothetical protein
MRPKVPAWLDEMPLDNAHHILQGWHMIGHPMIRGRLRQEDELSPEETIAVIAVMRRRIRRAAWDHDVVLHGTGTRRP